MKKLIFIGVLLFVFAGYFSCQEKAPPPTPEKLIADTLLAEVDSFSAACEDLGAAIGGHGAAGSGAAGDRAAGNEKNLQELFLRARLAYKNFEWAAEYFEPAASRLVNGPPVEEVEASSHAVSEPAGLQVMEGYLFPRYDTGRKQELVRQVNLLQTDCGKYRKHFSNIDMFDWQVFDAVKLEVFRIMTLGITGFDDPLSLKSMEESARSLAAMQRVMGHYGGADLPFGPAISCLSANTGFNSFNRAGFIRECGNPLTTGISALEKKLNIQVIRYNRLLNQDAKTLFDPAAWNVDAYSPDPSSFTNKKKVALGKILFADPVLSGTGTRSCQSCHQPGKAFTDGLVKNTVLGNKKMLRRNTPTLINSALQPSQFYDLRVNTLEDQSLTVVQNIEEMHGAMKLSVKQLWADPRYRELFSEAFPWKDRSGIDTLEVMNAISCYIRSLVLLNSRFDEYMRGSDTVLSAAEIRGFNLFMGKAKCATCHYMPLFNGTFPPRYIKTESEVIGVPAVAGGSRVDDDPGRYEVVPIEAFRHAFKTPTVRNAARTAPYMHNGVFSTLDQVMDFYEKGGGTGAGMKLPNQTLPFDKLELSGQEKGDVIAFIRSLDSRTTGN